MTRQVQWHRSVLLAAAGLLGLLAACFAGTANAPGRLAGADAADASPDQSAIDRMVAVASTGRLPPFVATVEERTPPQAGVEGWVETYRVEFTSMTSWTRTAMGRQTLAARGDDLTSGTGVPSAGTLSYEAGRIERVGPDHETTVETLAPGESFAPSEWLQPRYADWDPQVVDGQPVMVRENTIECAGGTTCTLRREVTLDDTGIPLRWAEYHDDLLVYDARILELTDVGSASAPSPTTGASKEQFGTSTSSRPRGGSGRSTPRSATCPARRIRRTRRPRSCTSS